MSQHRIHIELTTAEVLLDLPPDVVVKGAQIEGRDLILVVDSEKDLGGYDLKSLYGLDETADAFVLGVLEPA